MQLNLHRFDSGETIPITIEANTKGAEKLKELGNAIDQTASSLAKMPTLIETVRKGFQSLSLVKLTYLFRTIQRGTSLVKKSVETAAQYEESLNLYTMALGKYAEKASAWSSEIANKLMIDESALMQFTGTFYNLSKGLGVLKDDAFVMSKTLTQLTYDMSSYLNISVEAANEKLISAMSGQARAIQGVGVAIQQATLQELAYSLGITKSVGEMTQAEKTYLRYIQILRSTTQMQGDLGRTIITPANAMRVLQTQVMLLGRAIGQALTPIVMEAIPWIMAFTNVLSSLAKRLADLLGYKIAEVDYSSAFESGADAVEDYGNAVKGAGNKIKNSLAPFDELNVVQSKSGGSGAGGAGGSVIPELSKYVDTYDMLAGYTDKLKKRAQELEEPIKKIAKAIGLIAGAGILGKLLGRLAKVYEWFKKIKSFALFKSMGDAAKGALKYIGNIKTGIGEIVKAATTGGFKAGWGEFAVQLQTFQNSISNTGKLFGLAGTSLASFLDQRSRVKEFNADLETSETRIFGVKVEMDSVAAAAKESWEHLMLYSTIGAVLGGPIGAVAAAASGVIGTFVGWRQRLDEIKEQAAWEEDYDTIFDGIGRSMSTVAEQVGDKYGYLDDYRKKLDELNTEYENSKKDVDNATDAITKWHDDLLINGDTKPTRDQINQLNDAYKTLESALSTQTETAKNLSLERLRQLAKETNMSEEEYNRQKKTAIDYYATIAALDKNYTEELRLLDLQKQQNLLTDEEYKEKLAELNDKYGKTNATLDGLGGSLKQYIDLQAIDWNFENPEKMQEEIQKVVDATNRYKDDAKTLYDERMEQLRKEAEETQLRYAEVVATYGETSKEAETVSQRYADIQSQMSLTEDAYKSATDELEGTLKNFLLSVATQADTAGDSVNLGHKNMKGILDLIKKNLKDLGKADPSKSIEDYFGKATNTATTNGKTFSKTLLDLFTSSGTASISSYYNSALAEHQKDNYEFLDKMSKSVMSNTDIWKKDYAFSGKESISAWTNSLISNSKISKNDSKQAGKNVAEGYAEGIKSAEPDVISATENVAIKSNRAFEMTNEIHSPSKVYYRYGEYIIEGLEKGIKDNSNDVTKALKDLSKNMEKPLSDLQKAFKNLDLSFNINTSVDGAFNSMLYKLEVFANRWRTAINTLMSRMTTTMNNVTVDKNNKIKYTAMPYVSIPRFDEGGYPTSGDMFFANENGRAEFISHVGNQTAVYNQDQMISALTNAITAGFNQISGGNTNVYIGNEKVYSGQGEYQNREADRYGTSTIMI